MLPNIIKSGGLNEPPHLRISGVDGMTSLILDAIATLAVLYVMGCVMVLLNGLSFLDMSGRRGIDWFKAALLAATALVIVRIWV